MFKKFLGLWLLKSAALKAELFHSSGTESSQPRDSMDTYKIAG